MDYRTTEEAAKHMKIIDKMIVYRVITGDIEK
ncbi:hypothetical protein HNQ54_001882 [Anaerocolumna cellulosilytica]|nr:hypothetical protein [Anaerocolumna cellulosilytica]